jgi:hypothetical protein
MTSLQEYDLEFKLETIVKGQVLCKLAIEAMDSENQKEERWQDEPILYAQHPPYVPTLENSWYNELKQYLQHGTALEHLKAMKKRELRLKYAQYQLVHSILFRRNYDKVLL